MLSGIGSHRGRHGGCASLMQYAIDQGGLDEDLHEIDWLSWVPDVAMGKVKAEHVQRGIEQLKTFLTTKTKAELQREGCERKWLLASVTFACGVSIAAGGSDVAVVDGVPSPSTHATKSASEPRSNMAVTPVIDGMKAV